MLSLHEIVWIRELVAHQSVEGVTRERVCPHDRIEIEGVVYRINYMNKQLDGLYHFTAILTDKEYKPISYPSGSANADIVTVNQQTTNKQQA